MGRTMKRVCFVILIALLLPASVRAQNFTGASQEILLAAERARSCRRARGTLT